MRLDDSDYRTPMSREEIEMRLLTILWNHPRCRDVQLTVIEMPRDDRGVNWTVSLDRVPAEAIFETADIVYDVQDVLELAA